MRRLLLAGLVAALPLAGCADMNQTQQRALSGTGMGAAGGAILGQVLGGGYRDSGDDGGEGHVAEIDDARHCARRAHQVTSGPES